MSLNVKYIVVLIVLILNFLPENLSAQGGSDQQLAQHYYNNGEFSKAKVYYENLYSAEPSKYYFTRLYDCYLAENDEKSAEKLLKRQMSVDKNDMDYPITLAQLYESQKEEGKASKIYESLIDDLKPNPSTVINLFNAFKSKGKNELAFQTITKGRNLLGKSYPLHFQFAEYYGASNQPQKMIDEYMDLIDYNATYKQSVQNILSRQIDFSNSKTAEYIALKSGLLQRTQNKPNDMIYSEMLIWFFIQCKDFGAALTQEQAIDKRLNLQGANVYKLGEMALQNSEYETARRAFLYVKNLGQENPRYYYAENALLNTRFIEITTLRNYSNEEIQDAIREYQSTIERVGKSNRSLSLILELSHIQAFYGNEAEKAIVNLNEALQFARLTDMQRAEVKMKLADIHVLHGDVWDASLLYMQVDKTFKFEAIGQEARFKNARIFYYDGEFDYAQSQLDVLKQGTSKLISNDAIQLSLLITDNFGLDSNYTAMFWFATADLLIEQHKFNQAFQLFDSITINFPYHSLGDEILIKKSKAMQLQGNWNQALVFLDELLKYYPEDILADDALFSKGQIYQNHLFDDAKAMECYKSVLLKHPGSLYSTEARAQFRKLRGEMSDDELFINGLSKEL